MSDSSDSHAVRLAEMLQEHVEIRQAMERIQHARDLPELLVRLDEFRALVVPHFEAEEAPGGFFDLLRARASGQFGQLAELQREHRVLLDEIDRVANAARACLAGVVAGILDDAAALAARVGAHEARENRVSSEILYTDVGAQ